MEYLFFIFDAAEGTNFSFVSYATTTIGANTCNESYRFFFPTVEGFEEYLREYADGEEQDEFEEDFVD